MIKNLFKVHDKDDFSSEVLSHRDFNHIPVEEELTDEEHQGEEVKQKAAENSIPINMLDEANNIIICAELPNIDISSLKMHAKGKFIELSCIKKIDTTGSFLVKEIPDGRYARSVILSDYIDDSHSTATYENGLLRITLRKLEVEKSKEISLAKK